MYLPPTLGLLCSGELHHSSTMCVHFHTLANPLCLQENVLELVKSGTSVFFTGNAGTGEAL